MYDLIYGGDEYRDELKELMPTATIQDASDFIHEGRISIEIDMEEKEYSRIVFLNGFGQMSMNCQLRLMDKDKRKEFDVWFSEWKIQYPEMFKKEG